MKIWQVSIHPSISFYFQVAIRVIEKVDLYLIDIGGWMSDSKHQAFSSLEVLWFIQIPGEE